MYKQDFFCWQNYWKHSLVTILRKETNLTYKEKNSKWRHFFLRVLNSHIFVVSVDENEQDIGLHGLKFYENYLKKMFVGPVERFDQVPCEPRLWIKIAEYLESLVSVISDGVQSRGGEPGCFIILTASSQLNLAVFTNKRYRTGTVVPNTCGLTDLRAASSIETRIVPAAAIGTRDIISTWNDVVRSLVPKNW